MSKKLLVAHDFSPCADAALSTAIEDVAGTGELILLHVYSVMPLPAAPEPAPFAANPDATLIAFAAGAARERLDRIADDVRLQHPKMDVHVDVQMGAVAERVLQSAKDYGASRIYVGTHGRRGLAHFLLGSAAERIAREASVPVVVVKAAADGR